MKTKSKSKIKIVWPGLKKNYWNSGSSRNINGVLLTCILLSFASGFIDLVFFSGLSKSVYNVANIPVAASILFTIMSIGFISAKFWCAGRIGMLRELKSRLKAKGKTWYKNINKALLPWHIAHKFLIAVSLITAISLSVVSIGDAIRKNQNVIKRANTDIEKITKLANTTDKSDEVQFSALIKSSTASETAVSKAQADAAKIWPIIEDYRTLRAEFEAEFGKNFSSKEEVIFKGQKIIPDTFWDKQNSLVQSKVKAAGRNLSITQIRNITSEAVLANQIKKEIETSISNSASNKLEALSAQTKNKAIQEIENLQGRYFMPGSEEAVVFDPNNISGAIATLGDIKAAYENDTGDVGESSKVFMLIGPVLDKKNQTVASDIESAYLQEVDTSSFGSTEIMMMILIMVFGIVQEFLIAIFTPKATIDRKMLSQVSSYLEWKDEEEKERFLISVYKDYVGDGIINQEDFDAKVKKCVTLMEDTEEDTIEKYSKKNKALSRELKVENNQDLKNYVNSVLENQSEHYRETNQNLENQLKALSDTVIDLSNSVKTIEQSRNSYELAVKKNMEEIATMARKKMDADIIKVPTTEELKQEVEEAAKVSKPKRVKKTEEELKAAARERRDQAHMLEQAENLVKASSEATNPYTETPVPPKPQLQVFKEYDDVDNSRSIENNEVRKYRFGQTTVGTAKKMGLLIDHIFDTVDPAEFTKEDLLKKEMPISEKAFKMLFERLLGLSKDETRLIEYNSAKDSYTINFDKETLKNYILEEI